MGVKCPLTPFGSIFCIVFEDSTKLFFKIFQFLYILHILILVRIHWAFGYIRPALKAHVKDLGKRKIIIFLSCPATANILWFTLENVVLKYPKMYKNNNLYRWQNSQSNWHFSLHCWPDHVALYRYNIILCSCIAFIK